MRVSNLVGTGTVLRGGFLWTGDDSTPADERTYFREIDIISKHLRFKQSDDYAFYGVGTTTDEDRLVVVVRLEADGEVSIEVVADQVRP